MFIVISEVFWGHDGGCSTSYHAVCSTEQEAIDAVEVLQKQETCTDDNKPHYSYEPIGTPTDMTSLHMTNMHNGVERFDSVVRHCLPDAAYKFKGRKLRAYKYNEEKWAEIPFDGKIALFMEFVQEYEGTKHWYELDPEQFKVLAIEFCTDNIKYWGD